MKVYILKMRHSEIYLHAMLMGGEPFFSPVLATDREKAGIFEEDKANVYVEELNKQMPDREWQKIAIKSKFIRK